MPRHSKENLTTRLFVGCSVTSEIQMHVNHSIKWKHATLVQTDPSQELKLVYHQGKNYIGSFIDQESTTTAQLDEIGKHIKQRLSEYFPKFESKNVEIFVFPQVFVA